MATDPFAKSRDTISRTQRAIVELRREFERTRCLIADSLKLLNVQVAADRSSVSTDGLLEFELRFARRELEAAERLVERQRYAIASLRANGMPTALAEAVLIDLTIAERERKERLCHLTRSCQVVQP